MRPLVGCWFEVGSSSWSCYLLSVKVRCRRRRSSWSMMCMSPLRVPPQAALPNSKNRFSGFEPPKTTDRRPDVQVCFLIFCRRRLEAPTKKQKTDPDKKSKNRPQEMAVKTFPTSTRTNQNWLGGQQSTIRHDAATPISIIPMYCHHVRRCEC